MYSSWEFNVSEWSAVESAVREMLDAGVWVIQGVQWM